MLTKSLEGIPETEETGSNKKPTPKSKTFAEFNKDGSMTILTKTDESAGQHLSCMQTQKDWKVPTSLTIAALAATCVAGNICYQYFTYYRPATKSSTTNDTAIAFSDVIKPNLYGFILSYACASLGTIFAGLNNKETGHPFQKLIETFHLIEEKKGFNLGEIPIPTDNVSVIIVSENNKQEITDSNGIKWTYPSKKTKTIFSSSNDQAKTSSDFREFFENK